MKQQTLTTFAELVEFIHDNELSTEDINTIVHETIGAYFTANGTKEQLLHHLVQFWGAYGHLQEVPLFITIPN